eukprot:293479_1
MSRSIRSSECLATTGTFLAFILNIRSITSSSEWSRERHSGSSVMIFETGTSSEFPLRNTLWRISRSVKIPMSSSLSETTATEYPRLTHMTRAASATDVRELTHSAPRAVSVVNRERTHVDSEGGVREPRKTEEDFADDGDELLHLPKYCKIPFKLTSSVLIK